MTEDKNDMFSGESGVPEDKKLLEYLNGSLPDTERNNLEEQVPDNPFLQDAVEGLQEIPEPGNLPKVVSHLNRQLHQQLAAKKNRGEKKEIKFGEWIYWAILIVLLLGITGFLMLRFMLK